MDQLAETLACDRYHSKVELTNEGKARQLKMWIKEGTLVVATNALGLGVDVPDVRLVVHAGMPTRLRDYVQESGRAGRDGKRSEAVVFCRRAAEREKLAQNIGQKRSKEGEGEHKWEDAVQDFVGGKWCRRVILDGVMDGWIERSGCERGEELCNVCEKRHWDEVLEAEVERIEEDEESTEVAREIKERFDMQQRAAGFEQWKAEGNRMRRGEEVNEFMEQLERWVGSCVMCRVKGREEVEHEFEAGPRREDIELGAIQIGIKEMEKEMFTKKRSEDFSACFDCGLPQWICSRWEAKDDDGGRFGRVRGRVCRYRGMLARVYAGVYMMYTDEAKAKLDEMMTEDGFKWEDDEALYKWLGGYIKWAGVETNRLCRAFYYFCSVAEEIEAAREGSGSDM